MARDGLTEGSRNPKRLIPRGVFPKGGERRPAVGVFRGILPNEIVHDVPVRPMRQPSPPRWPRSALNDRIEADDRSPPASFDLWAMSSGGRVLGPME